MENNNYEGLICNNELTGSYTYTGGDIKSLSDIGDDNYEDHFDIVSHIKELTIADNVNYIGGYQFSEAENLKQVEFNNNLQSISHNAFTGCKLLKTINIPNGVTYIGHFAFYGCTNLKEIVLPDSITKMGEDVFSYCPNLTIICSKGSYAEQYAKEFNINVKTVGNSGNPFTGNIDKNFTSKECPKCGHKKYHVQEGNFCEYCRASKMATALDNYINKHHSEQRLINELKRVGDKWLADNLIKYVNEHPNMKYNALISAFSEIIKRITIAYTGFTRCYQGFFDQLKPIVQNQAADENPSINEGKFKTKFTENMSIGDALKYLNNK